MGKDFDDLLKFILVVLGAAAVIKIIDEATKKTHYKCPGCGADVLKNQNPCPYCRTPLGWA